MSCPYELFDQIMEAPVRLRCVTMLLMVGTFFTMIPFGWVRSEGSRPPEVGHVLNHRKKLLIGYGKRCEGRQFRAALFYCLRSDGLSRSGILALLSAPLLDACPATKICWLAARTSYLSIEYLLARRNKSSIVVGGFLASNSKNGVPRQMLRLKICRTTSML